MADNLDWEKILNEFDKDMIKAEIISNQIIEERKKPGNYNLEEMSQRVNNFIEENNIKAIYLDDKEGK